MGWISLAYLCVTLMSPCSNQAYLFVQTLGWDYGFIFNQRHCTLIISSALIVHILYIWWLPLHPLFCWSSLPHVCVTHSMPLDEPRAMLSRDGAKKGLAHSHAEWPDLYMYDVQLERTISRWNSMGKCCHDRTHDHTWKSSHKPQTEVYHLNIYLYMCV